MISKPHHHAYLYPPLMEEMRIPENGTAFVRVPAFRSGPDRIDAEAFRACPWQIAAIAYWYQDHAWCIDLLCRCRGATSWQTVCAPCLSLMEGTAFTRWSRIGEANTQLAGETSYRKTSGSARQHSIISAGTRASIIRCPLVFPPVQTRVLELGLLSHGGERKDTFDGPAAVTMVSCCSCTEPACRPRLSGLRQPRRGWLRCRA